MRHYGVEKCDLSIYDRYPSPKYLCRMETNNLIRNGKIIKKDFCEQCKKSGKYHKIYIHHKDYTNPRDIVFVCVDCHLYIHRGKRRAKKRIDFCFKKQDITSTDTLYATSITMVSPYVEHITNAFLGSTLKTK